MSHQSSSTASHKKNPAPGQIGNAGGVPGNAGRGSKVFTRDDQRRFLKKYRKYKNVDRAAKAIGFRGTTVFRQIHRSKRFAAEYEEVRMEMMGALEEKLRGFAFGTEMPVHNSQITAIFGCLRAFKPERWRENMKVGVTAEGDFATLVQGMAAALAVNTQQRLAAQEEKPSLEHKE